MTFERSVSSIFSHFYLDGEAAFMDGDALERNPYVEGDEAAAAWSAGWLAASRAASLVGTRDGVPGGDTARL